MMVFAKSSAEAISNDQRQDSLMIILNAYDDISDEWPSPFARISDSSLLTASGLLKLQAAATAQRFFFSGSDTNCPVQEFFKSAMNNVAVAKQCGYRGI